MQGAGIGEVRKVAPGGLFLRNQNASGDYLFETRPQFAKQDQWTSSDYLLDQIAIDPAMTHKRLGDGFYEQRLVREQLSQLAGRTKLSGASDDSIYKELLTNGVSAAHQFGLRPGIALSAEQVAHLTSDIVWMVSETVQLPDGRIETVLVPKVYAATLGREALQPGGALVTGNGVTINVTESIANVCGVIDGGNGRTLLVAGQDIVNRGGSIAGATVGLDAGRDIRNESLAVTESWATSQNSGSHTQLSNQASITATGALTVQAGRNLTDLAGKLSAGSAVITAGNEIRFDTVKTGSTYHSQIGGFTQNDSSVTHQLSQLSTGGDLTMKAGGDLTLRGTQVAVGTGGKGSGLIAAGGAVNIAAVTNEANSSLQNDPNSKSHDKQIIQNQTVVGAGVAATGDLTVRAGVGGNADLNITGSALAGGGKVVLTATRDVNIVSATEDHLSDVASHRESSSTFKKSSTTRSDYSASTLAIGSSISGENVIIAAGNDIKVGASEVTANDALTLDAGRDLIVTTAASTGSERHALEEKKSGFSLSAGGLGYSKGQAKQANSGDTVTQVGSVLSGASVTASSGRDTLIQGSTVVADENIAIAAGRDLSIVSAENSATETSASSSKKSGMLGSFFQPSIGTVKNTQDGTRDQVTQVGSQVASLGGNVQLSAGNKYTQTASDVQAQAGDIAIVAKDVLINAGYDTTNGVDHTTYAKTAVGGTVTVPVIEALKTVANMADTAKDTGNSRMKALAALNSAASLKDAPTSIDAIQKAGIRVSISLGNNKSESNTVTAGSTAVGSSVNAGGNVTIVATGAGKGSNISAIGSDINAGKDVTLAADNAVNLVAAENTASQHSTNKSSGSSIGVGFGIGGTSNGFTIDLAVSKARGNADGDDLNYTNTHVGAGNNVTVISGGDTTLKGGVISGNSVVADIGGDLNIESLQDRSTFESKQKSAGLNASLCIPPLCYGVSTVGGSFSKSKVEGDFLSVQEQSAIKAGDGGFQVVVGGNTDLKGGVLSSSQKAIDEGRNLLVTGSLTASDLQNKDEHSASGFSMSGSVSGKIGDQSGTEKPLTAKQQAGADELGKPGASGGIGAVSGSQSSVTRSGISGGTVVIADEAKQLATGKSAEAVLAGLDRVVTSETSQEAAGALAKGWDAQQLQKDIDAQVAITQKFSMVAPKQIGDFADKKVKDLELLNADPAEIARWKEGGTYRTALHTVSGALTGGLNGAIGAGTVAGAADYLDGLQKRAEASFVEQGVSPEAAKALAQSLAQITSLGVGAAVGGKIGGATGLVTDTNNRQLHDIEKDRIKKLAGGDPKQETRLTMAGCALVRCYAEYPEGSSEYATLKRIADIGASPEFAEERAKLSRQEGMFDYSTTFLIGDVQKDAIKRINNTYQVVTRAIGAGQVALGSAGVAGSVVTAPASCATVIGCYANGTVAVISADQVYAGAKQLVYGKATETFLNQGLQTLGMSPEAASWLEAGIGIGSAAKAFSSANKGLSEIVAGNKIAKESYLELGSRMGKSDIDRVTGFGPSKNVNEVALGAGERPASQMGGKPGVAVAVDSPGAASPAAKETSSVAVDNAVGANKTVASELGAGVVEGDFTAVKFQGDRTYALRPSNGGTGPLRWERTNLEGTSSVHGNSLSNPNPTHVYSIFDEAGSYWKIGESAGELNAGGLSLRAESQVRDLNMLYPDKFFTSEIRNVLPNKALGRAYETRLIERYRSIYGDDLLPGNITNR